MSDDEETYGEPLKVSLKPRCDLGSIISQLVSNDEISCVELNMYKQFLEQTAESEVEALFDILGHMASLKKLTIASRGSATQTIPAQYLAHCLHEGEGIHEIHLEHIKVKAFGGEIEDLAAALGEHPSLKVLDLQVENIDVLQKAIVAAGSIPTLEVMFIETAVAPRQCSELAAALEALCTSKSLKKLTLINMAAQYEDLAEMTRLLGINQVLEELTIKVTELDLNGGHAVTQMLMASPALKKLTLQMDTMDKSLTPEFVKALDHNHNINYLQLLMDGRMSDMKVARSMVVAFRDGLKGKFKSTSKVGLNLGVVCERIETEPPPATAAPAADDE